MALVPYTNTTPRHVHVAGKTVKPGETRMVDSRLLPTSKPPDPLPVDEGDGLALVEIQALSVKELREALSDLSVEDLEQLGQFESASESPRTTALEAIQDELNRRQPPE